MINQYKLEVVEMWVVLLSDWSGVLNASCDGVNVRWRQSHGGSGGIAAAILGYSNAVEAVEPVQGLYNSMWLSK